MHWDMLMLAFIIGYALLLTCAMCLFYTLSNCSLGLSPRMDSYKLSDNLSVFDQLPDEVSWSWQCHCSQWGPLSQRKTWWWAFLNPKQTQGCGCDEHQNHLSCFSIRFILYYHYFFLKLSSLMYNLYSIEFVTFILLPFYKFWLLVWLIFIANLTGFRVLKEILGAKPLGMWGCSQEGLTEQRRLSFSVESLISWTGGLGWIKRKKLAEHYHSSLSVSWLWTQHN